MWRYNLSKNHCSLLLLCIIVGIDSLTSSTTDLDCECPSEIPQNAHCSKETDCKWVCNDGYSGSSCEFGRIRLTSSSGFITDGIKSYTRLSKRTWYIDSGNRVNASIHFQIDEFFTECNWDHLYIFDGDSIDSPLLAAFNGHIRGDVNSTGTRKIPQEIIAKSGKAYIYFYSDINEVGPGFNISYRIIDNCSCVNGRCTVTAGLCECDAGWAGRLCDVRKNCSSLCVNGACNQSSGNCVCPDGFTGSECNHPIAVSYWTSLKTQVSEISPRSSHAAAVIGDDMWVYNGYRFFRNENGFHTNLYRYNLKDKTWTTLPIDDSFIWGHSMVAYQGKLIVFGGASEGTKYEIRNTLAVFDTNSSSWSSPSLNISPVAVTGHTATIVEDKMIVIFGLSMDGIFPGVQEYNIGKSEWQVIETKSAFAVGRHGHTSVYDPISRGIYVYGGVKSSKSHDTLDSLMVYDPQSKKWFAFPSSKYRQTLHSAVILDGMMIVFGGNPYIGHETKGVPCHVTKLHVYDLVCQKWHSVDLPQVAQSLARYGHTAVTKERKMYVFGGFNGALFNDILIYSHGECNKITSETECLEKYFSAGCYWNNSHCVNKNSVKTKLQCPVQYQKNCSEITTCGECTSHSNCGWISESCQVNGSDTCPASLEKDLCPLYLKCTNCKRAGCHWNKKLKCQKPSTTTTNEDCGTSCYDRKTLQSCIPGDSSCMWCENLERCVDKDLYVVNYPYGQCLEWTTDKSNNDVSCSNKTNCIACLTLPGCGWSEGALRNGVGRCLRGSVAGPKGTGNYKYWSFFHCPLCQCNGHSNCSSNSSVCLRCRDHTTGEQCESCGYGYFGNPGNGQQCQPCQCNGHADTCDPTDGRCKCRMKGVQGLHCDKCASDYVGNATNGGYCYFLLMPDYLYRINVSDKTMFNFICAPNESDRDTVVTVDIIERDSLNPALLNISVGSDTLPEVFHVNNVALSSEFERKFSKDNFPFGSNNFHFMIYVYNITPHSKVLVSVHQPSESGIDLLKFFIIFLACFIGLLIFAVIFWKAKAFFDTFRRTRRRNVELVYMTNRPFASVPICVDKPGHVPMKSKPSPLTSEICCGSKASVITVLVRLPLCAQAENSSGAASLCLGSALVSCNEHQGSKMVNYMKNIKRRRNPFRSSPT